MDSGPVGGCGLLVSSRMGVGRGPFGWGAFLPAGDEERAVRRPGLVVAAHEDPMGLLNIERFL